MSTYQRLAFGCLALGAMGLWGCGSFVDDLDLDTFTQARHSRVSICPG